MTICLKTQNGPGKHSPKSTGAKHQTTNEEFDMTQCNQNRPVKAPEGFTQAADEFAPDGLAEVWTSPRRFTNDGYVIEVAWLPESGFEYEVYRQPGQDGCSMSLDGVRDLRDALTTVLEEAASRQGANQ